MFFEGRDHVCLVPCWTMLPRAETGMLDAQQMVRAGLALVMAGGEPGLGYLAQRRKTSLGVPRSG